MRYPPDPPGYPALSRPDRSLLTPPLHAGALRVTRGWNKNPVWRNLSGDDFLCRPPSASRALTDEARGAWHGRAIDPAGGQDGRPAAGELGASADECGGAAVMSTQGCGARGPGPAASIRPEFRGVFGLVWVRFGFTSAPAGRNGDGSRGVAVPCGREARGQQGGRDGAVCYADCCRAIFSARGRAFGLLRGGAASALSRPPSPPGWVGGPGERSCGPAGARLREKAAGPGWAA